MGVINLDNVFFRYPQGKKDVIKGINLSIEEGDYICILGSNGSGKSTLAKLFNGLLEPTQGEVMVYGNNSKVKKEKDEIKKNVGMVFQNPDNQMVATIIEDDIAFGPENIGVKREEIGERIEEVLKIVDMEKYRYSSAQRLSGGQKQRIAIAGVLAIKPKVIIFDESTSMLDPRGRKEVLSTMRRLNNQGMTIITITHYMDEALEANRVIVLDEGEIKMDYSPIELFNREKEIISLGLQLPRSVYIRNRLRERGLPLDSKKMGDEELGDELCKLFVKG